MDTLARRVVARFLGAAVVGTRPEAVGTWLLDNVLKMGQRVRVWTGRGKGDFNVFRVDSVKLWPKPNDPSYPRDGLSWRIGRKDDYVLAIEREPAYEGEARTGLLQVRGFRGGDGSTALVTLQSGRGQPNRVYKLELL